MLSVKPLTNSNILFAIIIKLSSNEFFVLTILSINSPFVPKYIPLLLVAIVPVAQETNNF